MKMSFTLLGLALLGSITTAAQSQPTTPTSSQFNLDFEKGLDGWTDKETLALSHVVAEAAHGGKQGLRLDDQDAKRGSALSSPQAPVTAHTPYQLSFWAKTQVKNGAGVWARFFDQNHRALGGELTPVATLQNSSADWTQYKTAITTPDKAAFVAFWVHSYTGAQGTFDFDDFTAEATGTPVVVPVTPAAPATLPAPVARKTPAYIMIKVDDLVGTNDKGGVNPRWQKLVDFLKARNVKSGIGIIANSLEKDNPAYFQWIKEQQATGLVEFWNHGYDHKQWDEGGKTLQEFKGTSYELQKQHLERSQTLAREKLGFPFRTFGAPFNATDENTVKALQSDADTQIWLYGDLKTPAGKVVLDRVEANIENPTFVPDVQKLATAYNRYSNRDFFVIQGHPAQWTDERFDQFVKIVDFLTQAGAIFVTPSEYVRLKHPEITFVGK